MLEKTMKKPQSCEALLTIVTHHLIARQNVFPLPQMDAYVTDVDFALIVKSPDWLAQIECFIVEIENRLIAEKWADELNASIDKEWDR